MTYNPQSSQSLEDWDILFFKNYQIQEMYLSPLLQTPA